MMSRACYLRPAVRELDRVLALGGVVSLALRVVMDVPRVGVCHVVSEVVICWHLNTTEITSRFFIIMTTERVEFDYRQKSHYNGRF